jgi:hypothetical protein
MLPTLLDTLPGRFQQVRQAANNHPSSSTVVQGCTVLIIGCTVLIIGLPCLDRTDSASFVQSQVLPRNVRWLCWLEQALVAMLRI